MEPERESQDRNTIQHILVMIDQVETTIDQVETTINQVETSIGKALTVLRPIRDMLTAIGGREL